MFHHELQVLILLASTSTLSNHFEPVEAHVFLGCYKDAVIRDLNIASFMDALAMTVDLCTSLCTGNATDSRGFRIPRGQGLPFAGLQNGVDVSLKEGIAAL
ncbi:hypothetical protein HK102_000653, partial [Quaeritorhiza haematococci]